MHDIRSIKYAPEVDAAAKLFSRSNDRLDQAFFRAIIGANSASYGFLPEGTWSSCMCDACEAARTHAWNQTSEDRAANYAAGREAVRALYPAHMAAVDEYLHPTSIDETDLWTAWPKVE